MIIIWTLLGLFIIYAIIPTFFIRQFGYKIIQKGSGKNQVAITFDDGPDPEYTERLLDLLKQYEVKATFFVVGQKALMRPEIVKRIAREGHKIGMHNFLHASNWLLLPFSLKKQLQESVKVIENITGEKPVYYRPPWGHFNLFVPFITKGFNVVMWSAILGDWKKKTCQTHLLERLHKSREDGAIIVLHDSGETLGADNDAPQYMLVALEQFLAESVAKGTKFVTIDKVIASNK